MEKFLLKYSKMLPNLQSQKRNQSVLKAGFLTSLSFKMFLKTVNV